MDQIERENNTLLVFESAMARMEREHDKEREKHIKSDRWKNIIIILLILVAAVSNALWIRYENSFVDEEWTYEASTENGGNAVANGSGEVNIYGESESDTP